MYINYYYTYIGIVLSCIGSGCCCSEILCKTWSDYFGDINGCKSIGAVDRATTEVLSYVPFVGLSNFYMGYKFNGFCELVNAAMIIFSILAKCCCHTHCVTNCIAGYITIFTVFLDLAKIIHMFIMGSADVYEIVLMIISIVLIYLYCCYVDCTRSEAYGIIPAILVTVATGILETARDVYAAAYYDRDGNNCPFI